MRRTDFRSLVRAIAFLGCGALLLGTAVAQPRTAQQPVATQSAPLTPSPGGPAIPPLPTPVQPEMPGGGTVLPTADIGICQCIADRAARRLSCLSSAAECQSNCASTHYAFTPHAIYSCPMIRESANSAMSPSR